MSLSKRSKFDLPLGKMDLLNDTKGIENLLKSEGITTYEPGVVELLLNEGYSLIKDELLNRKNRTELAKACGNIYPSAAAAAMDTGTLPQEWLPKSDNEVVDLTLDSVSDQN
ncbi:uncharacterized protein LOC117897677 [Drosophila subobscura]|uniref:uncharacterized protein LOC117897677 n=1 Tax=Drosophila subobscura TaxID=7241 RepID=UPI00155B1B92|nr:uncharacterized protein LOC117897677 [Drosophila subobscura]